MQTRSANSVSVEEARTSEPAETHITTLNTISASTLAELRALTMPDVSGLQAVLPHVALSPIPGPVAVRDPQRRACQTELHIDDRQRMGIIAQVFLNTSDGIMVTDAAGTIVDVNPGFCRITGFGRHEVLGKTIGKSTTGEFGSVYEPIWEGLLTHGQWQGELWSNKRGGQPYAQWLSASAIVNERGEITHYVGTFCDITDRKVRELQREQKEEIDEVTGLPNRFRFQELLEKATQRASMGSTQVALLLVEIESLSESLSTLAPPCQRELVVALAARVQDSLRDTDIVARISESEFAVLLAGVENASKVSVVARKLVDAFANPFRFAEQPKRLIANVGIAMFPEDSTHPEGLMRSADIALFHAKGRGLSSYRFYSTGMHNRSANHASLESDLRRAIEQNDFILHYQPRVDMATGQIRGVEALVRWKHPRHGLVPPSQFIPLAEQTRLIMPIGQWVLRHACMQAARWRDEGMDPLRIAVNLSAPQFEQRELAQWVGDMLAEYGLAPQQLELEITESLAMRNPDRTIQTLLDLRDMGVEAAIDDFGTGYSSLAYLKRLPIYALKIDRSFVRDLAKDPDDANIARAIVALAHSLRLRVVAEGVESHDQLTMLSDQGCDEVQGFFTGRPMAADRLSDFLRDREPMIPPASRRTPVPST